MVTGEAEQCGSSCQMVRDMYPGAGEVGAAILLSSGLEGYGTWPDKALQGNFGKEKFNLIPFGHYAGHL